MGGVANPSLKSLKAAALNAQDAALRYQFQTSSFQEARNSSTINIDVESGSSPIELWHTSVADAGKGIEVRAGGQTVTSSEPIQVRRSRLMVAHEKRIDIACK